MPTGAGGNDKCVTGSENRIMIKALEESYLELRRDVRHGLTDLRKEVRMDVAEIKNKLLGRPTWAVTVIITILSTACVGMLILLLTMKGS